MACVACAMACVVVPVCLYAAPAQAAGGSNAVEVVQTTADLAERLTRLPDLQFGLHRRRPGDGNGKAAGALAGTAWHWFGTPE